MHLVTSVYLTTQRYLNYHSKNPAEKECIILKFKCLQGGLHMYIYMSCIDGAIYACLLRWALHYIILIKVESMCHTSFTCIMYSSSVRACLCVTAQARLCVQHSAFCAHRVHVGVLWNSSYKCTFTTTDI